MPVAFINVILLNCLKPRCLVLLYISFTDEKDEPLWDKVTWPKLHSWQMQNQDFHSGSLIPEALSLAAFLYYLSTEFHTYTQVGNPGWRNSWHQEYWSYKFTGAAWNEPFILAGVHPYVSTSEWPSYLLERQMAPVLAWAAINKILETTWLNNKGSFSPQSGGWKVQDQGSSRIQLWWRLFLACRRPVCPHAALPRVHMDRKSKEAFSCLIFIKTIIW